MVADAARTDKTICLAVSPALKSFGLSGRPRLFEVKQRVRDINYERRMRLPSKAFWDKSCDLRELQNDPTLELDYIIAPPRMRRYMEVSAKIHGIFLKYFSAEDIHVYSIDEVFVDLTAYLPFYRLSAHALAERVVNAVFQTTGITATVGIGTNLYLAKIAMWAEATRKSFMPQAYTPWGISQDIPSAKEERISYISFLASTQSC